MSYFQIAYDVEGKASGVKTFEDDSESLGAVQEVIALMANLDNDETITITKVVM